MPEPGINSIVEEPTPQEPPKVEPIFRVSRGIQRAVTAPLLAATLFTGTPATVNAANSITNNEHRIVTSIHQPPLSVFGVEPHQEQTATPEKVTWENTYRNSVVEAQQRIVDELLIEYGLNLSTELPRPENLTYGGTAVQDKYKELLIAYNLAQKLKYYPKNFMKNLSIDLYVADAYELWQSDIDPDGSFGGEMHLDAKTLTFLDPRDETSFDHEVTHAVMASIPISHKFYDEIVQSYPDCYPYLRYQSHTGTQSECHTNSFARDYGKRNDVEDAATLGEALYGKKSSTDIHRRLQEQTEDSKIMDRKLDIVKTAYYIASQGEIDIEYWKNLHDSITEDDGWKNGYEILGTELGISPLYIEILFPHINADGLMFLDQSQRLLQFQNLLLEDLKTNLPPDVFDFIKDLYLPGDKSYPNQTAIADLLPLLSTDLNRLDPELLLKLKTLIQDNKDIGFGLNLKDNLRELLTLNSAFFPLLRSQILNNPDAETLNTLIRNSASLKDMFSFYDQYSSYFEVPPEEYFSQVTSGIQSHPYYGIANSSQYGFWLKAINDNSPGELKDTLSSPYTFSVLGGVVLRDLNGNSPAEEFETIISTYNKWTTLFPESTPSEFVKYFEDLDLGLDKNPFFYSSFMFDHVMANYPESERPKRVSDFKNLYRNILNIRDFSYQGTDLRNFGDDIISMELYSADGDTSYRDFVKEFIEIISENPNVTISAKSLKTIVDTGMGFISPHQNEYKDTILRLISATNQNYVPASFDNLAEVLDHSEFAPGDSDKIMQALNDAENSEFPAVNLSTLNTRLKYGSSDLAKILDPLFRESIANTDEIERLNTTYVIISEIESGLSDQYHKDLFTGSIKYLNGFEDGGYALITSMIDLDNTLGTTNPNLTAEYLGARVHTARIFQTHGLSINNVPRFSRLFKGLDPSTEQVKPPTTVMELDAENTTPYDAIFELKLLSELNEQDVTALRDSYTKLKNSGVYPPIVMENIMDQVFNTTDPEIVKAFPELIDKLLGDNPEERGRAIGEIANIKLNTRVLEDGPKITKQYFLSTMLNPDTTNETLFEVLEEIAKRSDPSSENAFKRSGIENETVSLIYQVLMEQEDLDVELAKPEVQETLRLVGYFAADLLNSDNYYIYPENSVPRLLFGKISTEVSHPLSRSQIYTLGAGDEAINILYENGEFRVDLANEILSIGYGENLDFGKNHDRLQSLNPSGMRKFSKVSDYYIDPTDTQEEKFGIEGRG